MKQSKNYLSILNQFLYYLLFLVFVFALGTNFNMLDYDLWDRLISGKYLYSTGTLIQNDILSYTKTHIWIDSEWICNFIFYFTLEKFGALGLNLLKCFMFSVASFSILFCFFTNFKKKFLPVFLLLPVVFYISTSIYFLRCQIVSFTFFPIFLYFLEKLKNNPKTKYFVILAFINIIWQNCHGGFLISFVLVGIYAFGEFLNKNETKKFLILFIILFLIVLINPWGFDYYGFLIQSLTIKRNYIAEWTTPLLGDIYGAKLYLFYAFVSFFVIIFKLIKSSKKDFVDIFLVAFFFIYSLIHFKFATLWMIISMFYFSKYYSIKISNKFLDFIIVFFVCCYSFFVFQKIPIKYSHIHIVSRTIPIFPVEFLRVNNLKGNIYAPFGNSAYIAYKTYPNMKIFMDGREEQVYYRDFIYKNVNFMYQKSPDSNKIIEENMPDYFLCQRGLSYENYVKNLNDFKIIYDDGFYSIYTKKKNLSKYNFPDKELFYYLENIFDTNIEFK